MDRSPAAVGPDALVQVAKPARPQACDRGAGAQASRGAVEVRHPGRRHRGGRDEDRRIAQSPLPTSNLPRPDQPRKIRVDEPMDCMASNAATKNGPVLSSLSAASGILVRSPRATTECEFDLASNPDRRTGSNPGSQTRGWQMPLTEPPTPEAPVGPDPPSMMTCSLNSRPSRCAATLTGRP